MIALATARCSFRFPGACDLGGLVRKTGMMTATRAPGHSPRGSQQGEQG